MSQMIEQTVGQDTAPAETPVKLSKPPKKRRPKLRKLRKWIIVIVVAAAAGAVVLKLLPQAGGTRSETELTYTEAAAERRTITSSLSGSGALQPANSYTVTTLIQGEVLSAAFEEGDIVEADTVLYEIDSSDASTNIEKSQISLNQAQRSYENTVEKQNVRAAISGSVYELNVEVGDEVTQGQTVATIRESGTMTLTVAFPSDDAQSFYVGQAATATLDGSFETLSGTVKSISGSDVVGTGNMITRNVTISVANPGGLSTTQTATASVNGVGSASSGTFSYPAESAVTASVSGTVTALYVAEGDAVTRDQLLLVLGGSDLEDQIQSAQESLRNAELSMESTQDQLESYTITSPISGTIIDKQYKTGDTVESGKTLCTIYDLSYLEMTLNIDELDISKVAVGQEVQITVDAVEGATYSGVITKVSVAGTTTGSYTSYPVTIRIDETDGLLPGMNADAEIIVTQSEDTLAIPSGAVSRGDRVLVTADSPSAVNALEDEAPEGYVYVEVETGVSDDDYVEILSGLQEGDTVAYLRQAAESSGMDMMTMGFSGDMGGMPSGGGGMGGMPSGGGGPMG